MFAVANISANASITAHPTMTAVIGGSGAIVGGLDAESTEISRGVANLSATAEIAGESVLDAAASASLLATAEIVGNGQNSQSNITSLASTATIVAHPTMIAVIGGDGTILGSLDGEPTEIAAGAAFLQGLSDLTASAETSSSSSAYLVGTATLVSEGGQNSGSTASLVGSGALTANGGSIIRSTASLVGSGALTANGGVIKRSSTLNISQKLESLWKLDEESGTRYDSVGTNHLDGNGTPSAPGILGTGAFFSGVSTQSLSTASNSSLQIDPDLGATWAFWYKPDATPAECSLVQKDMSGGREYSVISNSTAVNFYVFSSSGDYVYVSAPNSLMVGEWVFVVAWWDASDGKVRIQVDNGEIYASGASIVPHQGNTTFRLGLRDISPTRPAFGTMDEVGYFRTSLTAEERAAIYNGGIALNLDNLSGLSGTAVLTANGGDILTLSSSLTADASVAGSGVLLAGNGAILASAAAISGTARKGAFADASLTGSAEIVGNGSASGSNAVNLSGTASILAHPTMTAVIGGEGTILGSIDGEPTEISVGAAHLQGLSNLIARGQIDAVTASDLVGVATLTASGGTSFANSADLVGVASLAASGGTSSANIAGLDGTASIIAHPTMTAVIGGEGTISGSVDGEPTEISVGAAHLQGLSDLIAHGQIDAVTAANLVGTASLVASGGISAANSVDLVGTASLVASGNKSSANAANLVGTASLVASGSKSSANAANLVGTASLVASGGMSAANSVDLVGTAGLTALGGMSVTNAANLVGTASLAASGGTSSANIAGLDGTASIIAHPTMTAVIGGEGTIVGSIDGEPTEISVGAAHLQGLSNLIAHGQLDARVASDLIGVATLAASGGTSYTNAADLVATASLIASGTQISENSTTLSAKASILAHPTMTAVIGGEGTLIGSIDGQPSSIVVDAAHLQGIATLQGVSSATLRSQSLLSGIATLSTTLGQVWSGSANLVGIAELDASNRLSGEASLDCFAAITSSGVLIARPDVSIAGNATITAVPTAHFRATGPLNGVATLSAGAGLDLHAEADLSAVASFEGFGLATLNGLAVIYGTAEIDADGIYTGRASSSVESVATILGSGSYSTRSSAALVAEATINANGTRLSLLALDLHATSALDAEGSLVSRSSTTLAGVATIAASPTSYGSVDSALTGVASINAAPSALIHSDTTLTGVAIMDAMPSLNIGGEVVLSGDASGAIHSYVDLETSFDVLETDVVGIDFEFDVGRSVLRWYQVETECRTLSCATGVVPADNCSSTGIAAGHRVTALLAARGLSDLCAKLQAPRFNPALNLPIRSISRSSRPVYPTNSTTVEEVDETPSYIRSCSDAVVVGSSVNVTTTPGILNLLKPTATVGNLYIAVVVANGPATFVPPAGWSAMFDLDSVDGLVVQAFQKISGTTEDDYYPFGYVADPGIQVIGATVAWGGIDQFDPIYNYAINKATSAAVTAVRVDNSTEAAVDAVAIMVEPSFHLNNLSNGVNVTGLMSNELSIRVAMDTVYSNRDAWGPAWSGTTPTSAWVLTISPSPLCEESIVVSTSAEETATPDSCQEWQTVDFCHIAECVGFCVDSQPTAKATGYGRVISLYDSSVGGGIELSGSAGFSVTAPPPQTGVRLSGSATLVMRTMLATPSAGGLASLGGNVSLVIDQPTASAAGVVAARFLSTQYSNTSQITYSPQDLTFETECGCILPGKLFVSHNLIRASRLTSFLSRTGSDIPSEITLLRCGDGRWRKNYNFNSISTNESWRVVFEYYCHDPIGFGNAADLVWRFGVFAKNQQTGADLETRLLIEFSAETCPDPGAIALAADTASLIATANGVDADFILSDDCGMFASSDWTDDPVFTVGVGESTSLVTGRRQITNL